MTDYTTTPNLHLYKPNPGADVDTWGDHLNSNADTLDAALSPTGLFLPVVGGTLTGPLMVASPTSNTLIVNTTDGNTALVLENSAGANRMAVNILPSGGFTIFDYGAGGTATTALSSVKGLGTMPFLTGGALSNQALGAGGTLNGFISYSGSITGTKTAGAGSMFLIQTSSDTGAMGSGGLYGGMFNLNSGGAGMTGNRVALRASLNLGAGVTNKGLGTGNLHGSFWGYATASGNQGGTALTPGNTWGSLWGGILSASLTSGATFWTEVIGAEVDVGIASGASCAIVEGLKIALVDHDQAPGGTDYLLGFAAGAARCTAWSPKGISFGSTDGVWPFDTGATLVGTTQSNVTLPGIRPYTAANGIDLSAITFSATAFKSAGFQVDGAGRCAPLLTNAANDAAAASAGVPIGAMYRNANAVQVRLA